MKLFHSPGACSLGIRVLLEETGAPYETVPVVLARGEHRTPEYMALNPKAKVPALLRDDGSLLTEYQAISLWLGRAFPEAGLLPEGGEGEIRALEILDYVVATLHMRGVTFVFNPQRFVAGEAEKAALKAHGLGVVEEGLAQLEARLGDSEWFFDRFGIADAGVFYLVNWNERLGVELPPALAAFKARMLERPSVQRALA